MVAALIGTGLAAGPLSADVAAEDVNADRTNYSIGYAFGEHLGSLRRQGMRAEPEELLRGLLDALAGAQPVVDREEMRKVLDGLGETGPAGGAHAETGKTQAKPPARKGAFVDDFARLNAQRPGVVTLPSGVQYEVLAKGSGRTPGPNDAVIVSYQASLATGVVFDTTYDDAEPARLKLSDIAVPGLREALQLMKEGDKWRVVVPPSMGFGRSGNNMLRKRDLIYEIALIEVEAPEADRGAAPQTAPEGRKAEPEAGAGD